MKAVIKSTVNHPWRGLLQMLWLCEPRGYTAIIGLLWGCSSAIVPGSSVNKKIGFHSVYICWLILCVTNSHIMMNSNLSLYCCSSDINENYIQFLFPPLQIQLHTYFWSDYSVNIIFNILCLFLPLCKCT